MQKIDLTTGNIAKVITKLALPIMGSSFLQLTYNLVDMLWVGNLGKDAVASIGSASFFINMGYAIQSMVVIGTGIMISHAVGAKNEKQIKEYMNAGIVLNLWVIGVFAALFLAFGKVFIQFLHLDSVVVEQLAYSYLLVNIPILAFSFFNFLYIRVLGSFGNNYAALKISSIGIIINIILDPIFIYGLDRGVLGAAFATLIANIIMFVLFNIQGRTLLSYNKKVRVNYAYIGEIAKLGVAMAIQRGIFTFVNILLGRMIAEFGSQAIAAQKIALQIEAVTYMVIGGLNGATASFVGQNYGANKQKRIQQGYHIALGIGIIYASMTAIIFLTIPEKIVRLFIKDIGTIQIAAKYLSVVGMAQIFSTIEMVSNGMFTGMGMPTIPASISMLFTVLRIPMAAVLIRNYAVTGIWISISISSILKGIAAYSIYWYRMSPYQFFGKEHKNARTIKEHRK